MRSSYLAALLLVVACGSDRPPNGPPEIGGGGGGGGGGGEQLPTITGKLCQVDDFVTPTVCDTPASTRLVVSTLDTFEDVADDGRFVVNSPYTDAGERFLVVFADDEWFGAIAPFATSADGSARDVEIPIMRLEILNQILTTSNATLLEGSAVLSFQALDASGAPVAGAVFEDIDGHVPHYDTGTAGTYSPGTTTGARGQAVYFDINPTVNGIPTRYTSPDNISYQVTAVALAETLFIGQFSE